MSTLSDQYAKEDEARKKKSKKTSTKSTKSE